MRSIYFSEEHDQFRRTVRQFVEKEILPHADAWEQTRRVPRQIWRQMGQMGFLGILFPEAYGGAEADIFYAMGFLEELARSCMGGFCAAVSVQQFIATGAIYHQGNEAQRQRYLKGSIAGEMVGAICITEPDTGSDVGAIRTTAEGDDEGFVISGAKTFITNGVEADFYVVAAKTDKAAGTGGISLLVVDAGTPGIKTHKLNKVGWHTSDTAEVHFDQVRVSADALIGELNKGFYYIMQTFGLERLVTAATSIGSCQVALELTLDYMASREAFGKPIARFQALRHRLADLFAELNAVRQLVYHAAWLHQQGETIALEASEAKLLATELNKRVVDECLQFFGGYGYMEEYPIARFYRDARVSTIVAGTSEIMREIIAKMVIDGKTVRRVATRTPGMATPTTDGHETPVPSAPAPVTIEGVMHSLPQRLRPERAQDWHARFHFRFEGALQPEWTVAIDGPQCAVRTGHEGTADCVITAQADTYLGIETGREDAQAAFLAGKVQVSDLGAMMKFIKAFRPLHTL